MDELKLLPCPFCGDKPRITEPSVNKYGNTQWGVQCCDCYGAHVERDYKDEAIKAWNTRAEKPCICDKLPLNYSVVRELNKCQQAFNGQQKKYNKLVNFLNTIADKLPPAKELLKEIGENE